MNYNLNIFEREDLTPIRKLLMMHALAGGGGMTEYELTGNPVAFNTNVQKPLSGFTIPFLPIQSGTGNIRPISGWTGIDVELFGGNVYDSTGNTEGKFISSNGNLQTSEPWQITDYISVDGSAYIIYNGITTPGSSPYSAWYASDESLVSTFKQQTGQNVLEVPQNAKYVRFSLYKSGATDDVDSFTLIPSAQSYPVTFPAVGKNLFDKNAVTDGKIWWKGRKQDASNISASDKIPVIPGQAYTLVRNGGNQSQVEYFDSEGTYIYQDLQHWTETTSTYTIPSGVYFIAFNVVTADIDTAMFEKGSSASSYEPFTNTVYGGTLDAVNGVLTVTHKCVSLNDPDKWTKPTANYIYDEYFNDRKQGYREDDVCSCFRTNSRGYPYLIWAGQSINRYACYPGSTGLSIDDVKALAEANAIFCVYELAEPIEIPISGITVPVTLKGDNTVWTDTNGSNTIKYKKKG